MEWLFKIIEKGKIYIAMLNLFLIMPVLILTNIIYVANFGLYTISLNPNNIINSLLLYNTWFAIIIFTIILIFVGIIESIIMPFITIKYSKRLVVNNDIAIKDVVNNVFIDWIGIDAFKDTKDYIYSDKRHFMSACYKIPNALLLYSICFYNHIFIFTILFIVSIYLYYSVFYTFKSYLKNESNDLT